MGRHVKKTANHSLLCLAPKDQHIVLIAATRYHLSRRIYATCEYCEWLASVWPQIAEPTRQIMRDDINKELAKDDATRNTASGSLDSSSRMDYDRRMWDVIRSLWCQADAAHDLLVRYRR